MYRGFNIELNKNRVDFLQDYYKVGINLFNKITTLTTKQLDEYIRVGGIINGSELEDDWFPRIKNSHIFISHSHTDKELAIALAGYLAKKHKIKCFIDSCVWGYSNKLLRQVDNCYCKTDSRLYDYTKRNFSTSHVHMMLSVALTKMIDKCECLFFINTPNSIATSDILKSTYSPWIYSEIIMSKYIQKKIPRRYLDVSLESTEMFSKKDNLNEDFKIKYTLDLDHLVDLSEQDIIDWGEFDCDSPEDALNDLYENKPLPKKH